MNKYFKFNKILYYLNLIVLLILVIVSWVQQQLFIEMLATTMSVIQCINTFIIRDDKD